MVCCVREKASAMLLARIVDSAGRPIRPDEIATIEYFLCEPTRCSFAEGRRRAEQLDVDEVLLPQLVNDESWSVDVAGYNFRHCLELDRGMAAEESYVVVCYVFSSHDDEESTIRFRLKLGS